MPARPSRLPELPLVVGACPRARVLAAGSFVVLALVAAACSGPPDGAAPAGTTTIAGAVPPELAVGPDATVPPTLPVPPGFVVPDNRAVRIDPVPSKPKVVVDHGRPRLPMDGGTVTIRGTVFGPDGPVEGAVVRLTRYAGPDFGVRDLTTNKDGRYEARDLPGGRYKARAWAKPALTVTMSSIAFLPADHGEATLDLTLERHDGLALQGALDVGDPHVGDHLGFSVLLTQETVDDNGIVQGAPVPGAEVLIAVSDGLRVIGPQVGLTAPDGFAHFSVMCTTTGPHDLAASSMPLAIIVHPPDCLEGEVGADDAPPDALVPVGIGSTFTVPYLGPIGAGTYEATGAGPDGCITNYDAWLDGHWSAVVARGRTLVLTDPARNLVPSGDTKPCTYMRTA